MTLNRDQFVSWDQEDPLAPFRDEFLLPHGVIYLDGNSLGALPKKTPEKMREVIEQEWGRDLIRSWNVNDWIWYPNRVGDKIASLVGAESGEVIAADSTSVNLFKLLAAALQMKPDRPVILSERENFPTDLYMAQGLIDFLGKGHRLRLVGHSEIADAIDEEVAVVTATHTDFRSGRLHDMGKLTRAAHDRGALMLWDLSHSAGAMPVHLNRHQVDFAVGCGYKFLNGGPGAPAFLFVAKRHQEVITPPLAGWMGHENPFAFDTDYRPAPGIDRQRCGTPSVLGMAALEVGVDMLARADISRLREKSQRLGDLFLKLAEEQCGEFPLSAACPKDSNERGSQVSLRHSEGYAIMQALIAREVIGDFRTPDIIRFGLTPLYLRYVDVWDAVVALREILESETWRRPEFQKRQTVT